MDALSKQNKGKKGAALRDCTKQLANWQADGLKAPKKEQKSR